MARLPLPFSMPADRRFSRCWTAARSLPTRLPVACKSCSTEHLNTEDRTMDEHIARVLKMLEEGKISAEQAEKLISAISKETAEAGKPGASKPQETRAESSTTSTSSTQQDSGRAKSFDFQWSQKKG